MVRIQYNRPSLHTFPGGLRLVPGINQVDDAAYERVKEHPGFLRHIKAGNIVVKGQLAAADVAAVEAGEVIEKTAVPSNSKDEAREAMLADVAEMLDIKRLRKLANSKDKELAALAAERLEVIEKTAVKSEDNEA